MRKLRVLSCVLLVCFISCITLGSAFASGILIDDLPIDPWGDLEDVENYEPPEPTEPNFSDPYFTPEDSPSEDNGGVSFFSLNDDTVTRTVVMNSNFRVGDYDQTYWINMPTTNKSISLGSADGGTFTMYSDSSNEQSSLGVSLKALSGAAVRIEAAVDYPADTYEKITVSGGGSFAVYWFLSAQLYPDTVDLLINGSTVATFDITSNGNFSFPSVEYELISDVTTLGYRFNWTSEKVIQHKYVSASVGLQLNWSPRLNGILNDTATFVVAEKATEPEYNGLLDTIIGWLRNIWDGIKSIGQSILDGLQGLFVPSESDIVEIKEMYSALLEERLGFVYEAFVMLDDAFTELKTAFESGNDYTFTFPGISFPMNGEIITIVEEQEINMENEFMDTVRPVFGTIVCLFSVAGVVRTGSDMVVAIISGVSPFAFYRAMKEREGGTE